MLSRGGSSRKRERGWPLPAGPKDPAPGALGQETPAGQIPDDPRESLSSSPNDIPSGPRAPAVCLCPSLSPLRHGRRGSQRYLLAVVAAARVRCRPWPGAGGGFRRRAGVQCSAVALASLRPPPEVWAPAAGGRGWRLSPSDPAAEEGRAAGSSPGDSVGEGEEQGATG